MRVERWEPDGRGGAWVQWTAPAVIADDGTVSDLTAAFHLTAASCRDLARHHCRPNRRHDLDIDLCAVADDLERGILDDDLIGRWARCYGEIIQDRVTRQLLGLKAVTPGGHADLEAARRGDHISADCWDPHSVAARLEARRFTTGSAPTARPGSGSGFGRRT